MAEIVLKCPSCGIGLGALVPTLLEYTCQGCQKTYQQKDGVVYLNRSDQSWSEVQKEVLGTIECLKADGAYKSDPLEHVDSYPFFDVRDHGTDVNRVLFEMCLDLVGEKKGALLEIGAKNGWAANQFTKRGLSAVVTDITDDEFVGLRSVRRLSESTGRDIRCVLGDGAYLPFEDAQFDVVFMCSTLHHVREMDRSLREICRVLKPGGVFVDMGEAPRHPERTEQESLVAAWREKYLYHIDEKQPSIPEYYALFEQAGFGKYKFFPFDDMFLRNGFVFGQDKMLDQIRKSMESRKPHHCLQKLCDELSWKTKSMWSREDVFFLNWYLWIPNNCVWWAVK